MARVAKQKSFSFSSTFWLWIIFFLALLARVYHLGILPATFYTEEMTNTYVGKFILLHGRDIFGHMLPLVYFDKFGDYPPVLPLYLSGLGALLLGTSAFAGRLPIAIIGALLVFPMYALAMQMLGSRRTALFAALVTAVTPWHIVLSRTTAEGVVGLTVYAWALVWIIQGIADNQPKRILQSYGLFFLTYFLYPGLRLLTPLTLLPLPILVTNMQRHIKKLLIYGIITSFLLTGYIASTRWGRARFNQTSLFADPQIKTQIQNRSQSLNSMLGPNKVLSARIYHNKVVLYTREFVHQYLSYFSPMYLFFEGGGQYRYYNVPDQGLLYLALIPFLAAALLLRQKDTNRSLLWLMVYLLAVAPLSAALTTDFVPHAHRSMFMILPIILLAAGGYYELSRGVKLKRLIMMAALAIMAVECIYFWHQYAAISDAFQSTLRNDGDPEMVQYVLAHKADYDHVFMSKNDRIPLYYLFYANNFDKKLLGQFQPGFSIDAISNVTFTAEPCPSTVIPKDMFTKHLLLVDNASCDGSSSLRGVTAINRRDGTSAYRIMSTQ